MIGLRWADVDLKSDSRTFTVNRTVSRYSGKLQVGPVKTGAGHRTIGLSESLVALLKVQRKEQLEQRLKAGTAWSEGDYIFTTGTGHPLDPRNVLRDVEKRCREGRAGRESPSTPCGTVHSPHWPNAARIPGVVQQIAGHANDADHAQQIHPRVGRHAPADASMDAPARAFDF